MFLSSTHCQLPADVCCSLAAPTMTVGYCLLYAYAELDRVCSCTATCCHVLAAPCVLLVAKCSCLLQKLNHFTGMLDLCRKRSLARSIATMAQHMPQHYAFCPRTFVLPEQAGELGAELKAQRGHKRQRRTYIVKPDSGCQVQSLHLGLVTSRVMLATQVCIPIFGEGTNQLLAL